MGWLGAVPPVGAAVRALCVPAARVMFKRTGSQFFMDDAKGEGVVSMCVFPDGQVASVHPAQINSL